MHDLAIIGSGVMGTFHAFHAALTGKKVIVFEKDLHPMESSVRNFGQVVPSGFAPGRWHFYGRYATQLYKKFQLLSNIGIRNNGSVYIANTESELALLQELQTSFSTVDYPSVLLSKEETLAKYPDVRNDYALGSLFFPEEVSSESRMMIHALHRLISEKFQVSFEYMTSIFEIHDMHDSVLIHTHAGKKIPAKKAIVCNGRDFKFLFPEIFNQANIEVCKLNMMVTRPLPHIKLPGNILTGLTIRRYESFKNLPSFGKLNPEEVNPLAIEHGIHILFKQRVDGSIVIGDSHHYADVSKVDTLGFDYDVTVGDIIVEESKKILNLPDWTLGATWNGFYSQMKGDEEIFQHQVTSNIHIATAIGGKGMTASAGFSKEHIEKIFNASVPLFQT
jgi:FAD dependent oxidoreductase TIGR03364